MLQDYTLTFHRVSDWACILEAADWAYSPVEFDVMGVGEVKLAVAKTENMAAFLLACLSHPGGHHSSEEIREMGQLPAEG